VGPANPDPNPGCYAELCRFPESTRFRQRRGTQSPGLAFAGPRGEAAMGRGRMASSEPDS